MAGNPAFDEVLRAATTWSALRPGAKKPPSDDEMRIMKLVIWLFGHLVKLRLRVQWKRFYRAYHNIKLERMRETRSLTILAWPQCTIVRGEITCFQKIYFELTYCTLKYHEFINDHSVISHRNLFISLISNS